MPVYDKVIDPELDPGGGGGWDPPGVLYVDVFSQTKTTTPGKTYVASITLGLPSSTATVYLLVNGTRITCPLTSTMTRFEVAAIATETTTKMSIQVVSTQAGLVFYANEAQFEEGLIASTYHAGTLAKQVTVDEDGVVTFAAAPAGAAAIVWSGAAVSPTVVNELSTLWGKDLLRSIAFVQSSDVVIMTHKTTPPQWLGRYSDYGWVLQGFPNYAGPFEDINTDVTKTISLSAVGTKGVDITLTAAVALFTPSDIGKPFKIEPKDGNKPWFASETGLTAGMYRSQGGRNYTLDATGGGTAGTVRPTHLSGSVSDGLLSWTYHDQGFGVAIIKSIGTGNPSTTAVATVVIPFAATAASYNWSRGAWGLDTGYPGTVAWHQQRLVMAGSTNFPNTFWTSRSGAYKDFGTSNPTTDDDGITFRLDSAQVNGITAMMSFGALVAASEGGIWAIGDKTPLTGANKSADMQGFRGAAADIPLLGAGNAVLYVQDKMNIVRDLSFEWASNTYNGNDLNSASSHLIIGHKIKEWCYQPSTCMIFAIREDGVLLTCTYQREQNIQAWSRNDTQGLFESCCCVSEGDEDPVYVSVLRGTERHIERFAGRLVTDVRDGWFLDDAIKYDGLVTDITLQITLNSSTGVYTAVGSSASTFSAGDVADQIAILEPTTRVVYRFTVSAVATGSSATVVPIGTPLAAHIGTTISEWYWARNVFYGAQHLDGKACGVLADGAYIGEVTVSSGSFTLTNPAYKVLIGLRYNCDLEPVPVNFGEQNLPKKRLVSGLSIMGDETWVFKAGRDKDHLFQMKTKVGIYDDPVIMEQGIKPMNITNSWDDKGRTFIRVDEPYPVSIQAIIPEVTIGG